MEKFDSTILWRIASLLRREDLVNLCLVSKRFVLPCRIELFHSISIGYHINLTFGKKYTDAIWKHHYEYYLDDKRRPSDHIQVPQNVYQNVSQMVTMTEDTYSKLTIPLQMMKITQSGLVKTPKSLGFLISTINKNPLLSSYIKQLSIDELEFFNYSHGYPRTSHIVAGSMGSIVGFLCIYWWVEKYFSPTSTFAEIIEIMYRDRDSFYVTIPASLYILVMVVLVTFRSIQTIGQMKMINLLGQCAKTDHIITKLKNLEYLKIPVRLFTSDLIAHQIYSPYTNLRLLEISSSRIRNHKIGLLTQFPGETTRLSNGIYSETLKFLEMFRFIVYGCPNIHTLIFNGLEGYLDCFKQLIYSINRKDYDITEIELFVRMMTLEPEKRDTLRNLETVIVGISRFDRGWSLTYEQFYFYLNRFKQSTCARFKIKSVAFYSESAYYRSRLAPDQLKNQVKRVHEKYFD